MTTPSIWDDPVDLDNVKEKAEKSNRRYDYGWVVGRGNEQS